MSEFKRKKLRLKHWHGAYSKNGLSVDFHAFVFSPCSVQVIEMLEKSMSTG